MSLKPIEEQYLAEKQSQQEECRAIIAKVEAELAPIQKEVDEISQKMAPLIARKAELKAKKQEICDKYNSRQVSKEFSDAAQDVTKLLRKKRGAQ